MLFLSRVSVHCCYMRCGFPTREYGQSALKLPHMATLEALYANLLLKYSCTCDFSLNLGSRLGILPLCNNVHSYAHNIS